MSVSNIKIKPQTVFIGKAQVQIQTITCVADVSSSLNNKYFVFHDSVGAKRYAWFNVATAGTDPAPAGSWTGHEVAISANASGTTIATALSGVLTAVSGFDATSSGTVVTLTATATGFAQQARDINTAFAFKLTQLGMVETEVGCIQGDIEISGFEQSKVGITCHDSGTTVVDEIISGYSQPELTLTFQKTDKQSLQDIFVMYGMSVFTPVGVDQAAVFGYGPANVGGSNPKVPLRLHPIEKDASDKSEDWNFWSAELGLDTLNFSGENVSVVPASFNIYPDSSKPKSIQFFMIGNATLAGY